MFVTEDLRRQREYVVRVWNVSVPCPACGKPHNPHREADAGKHGAAQRDVVCECGATLRAQLSLFCGSPFWERVQ